jgi:hypothetical protein
MPKIDHVRGKLKSLVDTYDETISNNHNGNPDSFRDYIQVLGAASISQEWAGHIRGSENVKKNQA